MYCYFGLCQKLKDQVVRENGGWIEEKDFDLFVSPITMNWEHIKKYVVGFFMPDGKKFVITAVFSEERDAWEFVSYLNGGKNGEYL